MRTNWGATILALGIAAACVGALEVQEVRASPAGHRPPPG
jgi:hypothetical protein